MFYNFRNFSTLTSGDNPGQTGAEEHIEQILIHIEHFLRTERRASEVEPPPLRLNPLTSTSRIAIIPDKGTNHWHLQEHNRARLHISGRLFT